MHVTVRFFAILRERLGVSSLELDLPGSASVAAAIEKIASMNPQIAPMLERSAFAVNRAYSGRSTILQDKDELAIIPPVSGG